MFKIVDVEKSENDKVLLSVETDDASLFALVALFESLVEFSGSFRHKFHIAEQIKEKESTHEERMEAARADRRELLDLYESMDGSKKEKIHALLKIQREKVGNWFTLDGVISMLKLAREEIIKTA